MRTCAFLIAMAVGSIALASEEAQVPALHPAKDLDAAKAEASSRKVRIVAVVTQGFYPSEPCRRMEKALEDPAAAAFLRDFVLLVLKDGEDLKASKSLGLEDLGHPCTALLDAEGRVAAALRGAFEAGAWVKRVGRLAKAADERDLRQGEVEKAPGDARAWWLLSEALRELGRVREADDALGRAERADPEDHEALRSRFAFRRVEARVEDRMATQDFAGARTLLDEYDRAFPSSPRRPWIAFYRAVARAYLGEREQALGDLKALAEAAGTDEDLAALARERIPVLEKLR